MGTSLGLALSNALETNGDSDEEEEFWYNSPEVVDEEDYIDAESERAYRRRVKELYLDASQNTKDLIEEEYSYEETDEIITSTPYFNEDDVLVKETTEGLIEVSDPYIISEDEYIDPNIFSEFSRNTLIYYEDDDVLATDRDEVVHDVEEMIGPDALTNFGYMSGNNDVVFVRNIKLGSNFEIIRESGSYQELILGLSEEDVDYEKAKKFFEDWDEGKA